LKWPGKERNLRALDWIRSEWAEIVVVFHELKQAFGPETGNLG
jgi:hypothetical protein